MKFSALQRIWRPLLAAMSVVVGGAIAFFVFPLVAGTGTASAAVHTPEEESCGECNTGQVCREWNQEGECTEYGPFHEMTCDFATEGWECSGSDGQQGSHNHPGWCIEYHQLNCDPPNEEDADPEAIAALITDLGRDYKRDSPVDLSRVEELRASLGESVIVDRATNTLDVRTCSGMVAARFPLTAASVALLSPAEQY